jgi:4-hydroxy-tetrahydrodipicolinate synthase
MTAETTLRLAHDVENIVAVKEASGDFKQVETIIEAAPTGFAVYAGDDVITPPLMELGGWGVISTIGNVAPERMNEIVTAMANGDHTKALSAHLRLQPLMKELFVTSNPIMVKEALKLLGFDCGGVRLPLVDATPEQSAALKKVMQGVGIL